MSCPVDQINQQNGKVEVIGRNGKVFRAKRIIVAVPIPVRQPHQIFFLKFHFSPFFFNLFLVFSNKQMAGRIRYNPPMPPSRDTLTQRVFMGSIIKTHMYYKTPFWKEKGYSGQLVDDQGKKIKSEQRNYQMIFLLLK